MDNYIDFLLELSIDFSNVGSTYRTEQDLDVIKAKNQCHLQNIEKMANIPCTLPHYSMRLSRSIICFSYEIHITLIMGNSCKSVSWRKYYVVKSSIQRGNIKNEGTQIFKWIIPSTYKLWKSMHRFVCVNGTCKTLYMESSQRFMWLLSLPLLDYLMNWTFNNCVGSSDFKCQNIQ